MNHNPVNHGATNHVDLRAIARQEMIANGFRPDFDDAVRAQVARLKASGTPSHSPAAKDLRGLLWSSIDNDTSRDLDQIEVAERLPDGTTRVLVGIADVDSAVPKSSPIDVHAERESTTVYTGVENFSMIPEELSTGLTSLNENEDRSCMVIEIVHDAEGNVQSGDVYPALVRNRAQLTYNGVGAWLEGAGPAPPKVAASPDLQAQLKQQDEAAQQMRVARCKRGALNLESIEPNPVLTNGQITGVAAAQKNRATELIEDFMIAANQVIAQTLSARKVSSIRRVVRTPERWNRIVELAANLGETLPATPDSNALNAFLLKRRATDPDHSPDLSLAVIKLMGPGEYVVERPGDPDPGHFGLAVHDYTHSTAPNRRYADLVTQRLIKAALASQPAPYPDSELDVIAQNCTSKEDAARKVERAMRKHIAAVALANRVGEMFDAIVTGVSPKGTYVRTIHPPVEGRVMRREQGLDVGDRVRVTLLDTNPQRGFIDFARS